LGFWIVLGTANTSADFTFGLRRKLLPLVGPDDANTLIANLSDGSDLLASLGPVVGLSNVASGAMSRADYLEQFGHRGPNEFELCSPRPVENPEWLDHELSRFLKEPNQVQALLNRQKESFEAAWVRFAKHYPHKAKSMQRSLTQNAQKARLREQARSEYVRDRWLVRLFALRAGELTDLESDIFYLTLEEMQSLLSGNNSALRLIPGRKEMHKRLRALPPIPTIIRGAFDPFKWAKDPQRRSDIFDARSTTTKELPTVITGSPGSTGKVESIVRIIDDPKDGDHLQPGEILVAVQTDIAWTTLFPRAAAVVTDVGAPLSHAAIVARELGIPAVVGCGNATMLLKTGDRVRVDGGAGTVTIL
jgi:phosphohistidine swiveling domain-containing protein